MMSHYISCRGRFMIGLILLAGVILASAQVASAASATTKPDADLVRIELQFCRAILPSDAAQCASLERQARRVAQTLSVDGLWPDIDYSNKARSEWPLAAHLNRTLVMAKACRLSQDEGRANQALLHQTLLALKSWTDHDYQNPNWWWNQIGVPELLGESAMLLDDHLPRAERDAIAGVMKRSTWKTWTGANLTWGVINQIVRGCLEREPQAVEQGYARMYEEIRVVDPAHEGIQADDSFHQHGPQFYSGGYGRAFAEDVGRFIGYARKTRFQIPPARLELFNAYMLDGERWLMRGGQMDYSAMGREITRADKSTAVRDWTKGPIGTTGAAYGLANVARMLSEQPGPRRQEYADWAKCLSNDPVGRPLVGNKQFWCSDYMAHRRSDYFTSVKMFSTRIRNAEIVNSEGRKSEHLSDGANFIYLNGGEYRNIFPAWDWNKVPGTTAEQVADAAKIEPHAVGTLGKSAFAGGVSDGTYGLCAMQLIRGKLSARKAWFFFDHAYVCLGAGINLANDHEVVTDVNQAHLVGNVITGDSAAPLSAGDHSCSPGWVWHDRIGYIFPREANVHISNQPQSGRWSDFGVGSSELVTMPVFDLWIDHGPHCRGATYAYIVLPDASAGQTAAHARSPDIEILKNTPALQAVCDPSLGIVMIAFAQPGSAQTPLGVISADHACLMLFRKQGGDLQISAANPENEPLLLHVTIADHAVTISLPAGPRAGSSVTKAVSN